MNKDARGFFRTPDEVSQYLESCVVDAEMRMRQEDSVSVNTIVAAVRIPPSEIEEVSRHVMDLVPYLAETYPGSGFEKLSQPGLLFYFCGQQLTGEMANPITMWTQDRSSSRYALGCNSLYEDNFIFTYQEIVNDLIQPHMTYF